MKKGSGYADTASLADKSVCAEIGSAGESTIQGDENLAKAAYVGKSVQTDCLMEVNSGSVDFAVVDVQLANSYCGQGDYANLKIVDGMESDVEYYAIGFKKGSELTAKVNEQLDALAKDGTIKTLAEKYGVANTAITDFSDQKK